MNTVNFAVTGDDGVCHTVTLTHDASEPTTIHAVFDGSEHDLTDCSASSDGSTINAGIAILFFHDHVTISMSGTEGVVDIAGYERLDGVITKADAAAVQGFVRACGLPGGA